ncbi:hypothetical protein [Halovenus salina]|uniref:Uncharacterized protein n=1 Tax=Halovenus salina TaxID=1510225 RepID=A0ABD5W6G2_9EURY|nr:hypothetical protein [Halovenus salina]
MSEETASSIPARTLRVVYLVGIALNAVALVIAAQAGQMAGALTLGLILVYLGIRYRMLGGS